VFYDMFKKVLLSLFLVTAMSANAKLPSNDIHIVVTGGPSTSLGMVARLFEKYSNSKGVNVKLDWRPGADGIIGANYFASRPANGSTMLLSSVYEVTRDKTYQTFNTNDIAPVGVVHMAPMWIVANPSLPYNNLTELVTALKKNPQVVSWAITNKMFESVVTESVSKMGLSYNDLIATRFNANGPLAITAIAGGHLDVGLLVTPVIKPVVDSKKVKLLGVVNKDDYTPGPGVENLETVIGSKKTKHGHVLYLPTGTSRFLQD
jgi:tripartite-type tricarboxylate transporter receptor subunit TctC